MHQINTLFKDYKIPVTKINNQRQELIKNFVDSLNKEIDSQMLTALRFKKEEELKQLNKYKSRLTAKQIAIKLGHVPTEDLYSFHTACEKAKSYGKYFNWSLKVNK